MGLVSLICVTVLILVPVIGIKYSTGDVNFISRGRRVDAKFHRQGSESSSLGRARVQQINRNSTDAFTVAENLVNIIVNDTIGLYRQQEAKIYSFKNFTVLVNLSVQEFKDIFQTWETSNPLPVAFVANFSGVLDQFHLLTPDMVIALRQLDLLNLSGNGQVSGSHSSIAKKKELSHSKGRSSLHARVQEMFPQFDNYTQRFLRSHIMVPHTEHVERLEQKSTFSRIKGHSRFPNLHMLSPRSTKGKVKPRSVLNSNWWRPAHRLIQHLEILKTWLLFLDAVSVVLGTAEVQLAKKDGKLGNFSGWNGSDNINKSNLQEALERMQLEYNLDILENSTSILLSTCTPKRLHYLNEVVRAALKTQSFCHKSKDVDVAAGSFVFISEAVKCATRSPEIKTLVVVATNKLLLDRNVSRSDLRFLELVSFLSPQWEVLGDNWRIELMGEDGDRNSNNDGSPGYPGGSGPSFLGVTDQILGGSATFISIGGRGGTGADTTNPKLVHLMCNTRISSFTENNVVNLPYIGTVRNATACIGREMVGFPSFEYVSAPAGQGGLGGLPGHIEFISPNKVLQNSTLQNVNIIKMMGEKGKVGKREQPISSGLPTNDEMRDIFVWYAGNQPPTFYGLPGVLDILPLNINESEVDPRPPKPAPQPAAPRYQDLEVGLRLLKVLSREYVTVVSKRAVVDLIRALDRNSTIQSGYRSIDFVLEFYDVEKQLPNLSPTVDLLFYYDSLAVRSRFRAYNASLGNNMDDNIVLSFLQSAATGKVIELAHPFEAVTVVNMRDFLQLEVERVQILKGELQAREQYERIQMLTENVQKQIEKHNEELLELTETVIRPEIEAILETFTDLTQNLLDEILKLKEMEEENLELLKKYRDELESHQTLGTIFGGLMLLSGFVDLVVPTGGALSAGIGFVGSLLNPQPGKPPPSNVQLPDSVSRGNKNSALRFKQSAVADLTTFLSQLKRAHNKLGQFPELFKEAQTVIVQAQENITQLMSMVPSSPGENPVKDNFDSYMVMSSSHKSISVFQEICSKTIEEAVKTKIGRQDNSTAKMAADVAKATINTGQSLYQQYKDDQNKIEEATSQIGESEAKIAALNEHYKRVEEELLTEINKLFEELSEISEDLAEQSGLGLEVIKYRIRSMVRDLRLYLNKELTKGFSAADYIDRAMEKLEDIFTTLVGLYEKLDTYKQHAGVAMFTAAVAQSSNYYLGELKDKELDTAATELRFLLQGTVLLKRQKLVEGSFRMWKFPLVDPVLCSFNNTNLTALNLTSRAGIITFVVMLEKRLMEMITIVREANSTLGPYDKYVIQSEFKNEEGTQPFYTWLSDKYSDLIGDLLEGKLVHLVADPSEGPVFCEAIKFNRIALNFSSVSNDKGQESDLEKALRHYKVRMTHSENSYYILGNSTYTIAGNVIELEFSFKLKSNGLPVMSNVVYVKLLAGDLTLSPYSLWSIRIIPVIPSHGYSSLAPFKNQMNLHLEGSGLCFSKEYAEQEKYAQPDCSDLN